MKITSKDGKEFESVEACLRYEEELDKAEVNAKMEKEADNIQKFIINFYGKDKTDGLIKVLGRKLIIVHTLSGHKLIADSLVDQLWGSRLSFDGAHTGDNAYQNRSIRKISSKSDIEFSAKVEQDGLAIVVELADVPPVFDDSKCVKYKPVNTENGIVFNIVSKHVGNCKSEENSCNCKEDSCKCGEGSCSCGEDSCTCEEGSCRCEDNDKVEVLRYFPEYGVSKKLRINKSEIRSGDIVIYSSLGLSDLFRICFGM